MKNKLMVASAIVAGMCSATATAKDYEVAGYKLPADKAVTVVLMRPDVDVGELQGGGLPQPNAEWTNKARENLAAAFRDELASRKVDFRLMEAQVAARAHVAEERRASCDAAAAARSVVEKAVAEAPARIVPAVVAGKSGKVPEPIASQPATAPRLPEIPAECAGAADPTGADEDTVAQYSALHQAVVSSLLDHKFGMSGKLPTKKQDFDYTLGPGAAALGGVSGANYGLFVLTYDQFASASRKTMQVAGALGCLVGFCVIVSGGRHDAYVSLVELDSGRLVWFNLVRGSKGDVREAAGAHSLAAALLASMPTRPGETAKMADAH